MRVFVVILGALVALLGAGCALSGFGTYRAVDADGYISSDPGRVETATGAFVVRTSEVEDRSNDEGFREGRVRIRVAAERPDGGAVFIGIGPTDDVDEYLRGTAYELITEVEFEPLRLEGVESPGTRTAGSPAERTFWSASATGTGRQELNWPVSRGEHTLVIMNTGGTPGVAVEAEVGVKLPYLRGFGIGLMAFGGVLLIAGISMVVLPLRRH